MTTDVPQPPPPDSPAYIQWIFLLWKRVLEGSGAESTWTPGIAFGGGTTGLTYTTQTGRYSKIGNLVVFNGIVVLSAKGSSTGNATITGLPFTVSNNDNARNSITIGGSSFTYTGQFQCQVTKNTTTATLTQTTEAGTFSSLADTNFTNTTTLIFGGSYFAA